MANLPEVSNFDSVYQIETTDLVQGGASGVTNTPLKNLTNRTKWLKDQVESLQGSLGNKIIRDISELTLSSGSAVDIDAADIGTLFACTVSAITSLNLPAADDVSIGDAYMFSVLSTNNTHVNVTRNGSDTIRSNNANSNSVPVYPGEAVILVSNGVDRWHVIAGIKDNTQVGSVITHAANSAPLGYLKCNGAAVSRTTYARLFSIIGITFGVGDGSTTFNLPDLRGEFIRGWDDGRNIDAGRAFGSAQQGTIHAIDSTGVNQLYAAVMTSASLGSANAALVAQRTGLDYDANGATNYPNTTSAYANGDGSGGFDYGISRPRNIALLYCIKF